MKKNFKSLAFCLGLACSLTQAAGGATQRSALSSALSKATGFVLPVAAAAGCLAGTYYLGQDNLTPTQTKVALGLAALPVFGIGHVAYEAAWEAKHESADYFNCPFYEGIMNGALLTKWCSILTPVAVLGWGLFKK